MIFKSCQIKLQTQKKGGYGSNRLFSTMCSASGTTFFKDFDNITHRIILVLNTLVEYAVRGKSDVRGQGSCVVAELDVACA